jgi:DNA polymerase V
MENVLSKSDTSIHFYRINPSNNTVFPLYDARIPAGFPSPAADFLEEEIDLNKLLNPHPQASFIVRVKGDSMIDACIPDGAWLVVDRSIKPANNRIVVAWLNGEFTVKRYICNSSGVRLMPANDKYPPMPITEGMDFLIWGTVSKILIDTLKSY